MSWQRITLITLGFIALAQAAVFIVLLVSGPAQKTAPVLAVFDPDKSLEMFVIWSNGQVEDDAFQQAIPAFQAALQTELDRHTRETGQVVLRKGALLSPTHVSPADITPLIMEKVLAHAAF